MYWVWEPSVLVGLLAITGWYELSIGPIQRRMRWGRPASIGQRLSFHCGTFWVFIALASPVDSLADHALFSVHMVQHMLLTFAGPLLWVIGTPGWLVVALLPFKFIRQAFIQITHPLMAFFIFNGVMWFWHLPAFYDAALQYEGLHIVEHCLFIGSAVIGWWPVVGHFGPRREPPIVLSYLVAGMFACTALAAVIALSSRLLYAFYGAQPLHYGLTALVDQQIGGAVMWLPGDMVYMGLIAVVFYRWLSGTPPVLTELERKSI